MVEEAMEREADQDIESSDFEKMKDVNIQKDKKRAR